jgi:hypothetical protein
MKVKTSFRAEFNNDCDLKKSLQELSDFMVKDFQQKHPDKENFRVVTKRDYNISNAILPGSICYMGHVEEL